MAKESYYDLLGVSERATEAQIKAAYRKLAQRYHPDVNTTPGAEAKFTKINVAYSVLNDSLKRADYDQELSAEVVRRPAPEERAEEPDQEGFAREPMAEPPTRAQYAAAFSRVLISGVVGLIAGAVVQYIALARVAGNHAYGFIWGPLAGLIIAAIWSADVNFRVETFIGEGRLVRVVSFLRTAGLGLSVGYATALLLSFVAQSVHGIGRSTRPSV